MKTSIVPALAIVLATGVAFAQGGPSGGSPAKPIEAAPNAGMPAGGIITSEAEAKTRLEAQGYRNVSQLVKYRDGTWRGTAIRNAVPVAVVVSVRGEINAR
jgi:hypothetical protein